MSDLIKIFIEQHRDAFDVAIPDAHVLQGIEKTLHRWEGADAVERTILLDRVLLDTDAPSDRVWAGIEQTLHQQDCAQLDELECFIRDNRAAFDLEIPNTRIWNAVEAAVPVHQRAKVVALPWTRQLLRAAASVALLLSGVGLGIWYAQSSQTPNMAMGEVSGEYREVEQFYQRDIAVKQQKLATFVGHQPAEVDEDLQQLDQMMAELRRDLANVPPGNREQVVRAMIENYKAKASILERVLERLEESKPNQENSKQRYETEKI